MEEHQNVRASMGGGGSFRKKHTGTSGNELSIDDASGSGKHSGSVSAHGRSQATSKSKAQQPGLINYYLGVREEHDSRKRLFTSRKNSHMASGENNNSLKLNEDAARKETL